MLFLHFSALIKTLLLLITIVRAEQEDDEKCSINDLRLTSITAKKAVLSWNTDCVNVQIFKVYVLSEQLKACPRNESGSAKVKFPVGELHTTTIYQIDDLKPYADYSVEVVAALIDSEVTVNRVISFSTPEGVPMIAPARSDIEPVTYKTSLKFFWSPARNCTFQNGLNGGYRAEIWGADPWVSDSKPFKVKEVPAKVEEVFMQNLEPFTNYELRVFFKNRRNQWNGKRFLSLKARTESGAPAQPTNLTLKTEERSVLLSWYPPYPPTGIVAGYQLKYGLNRDDRPPVWIDSFNAPANQSCPEAQQERKVCWVVGGLTPNSSYEFEIGTKDEKGELSHPARMTVRTKPEFKSVTSTLTDTGVEATSSPTPPTSRSPRELQGNGGLSNLLIAVICTLAAIFVVFIVIIVIVHKLKVNKLRLRYERQQHQQQEQNFNRSSRLSISSGSNYAPGMSTGTNMTSLRDSRHFWSTPLKEIQSRKLPEIPSNQQHQQQESGVYSSVEEDKIDDGVAKLRTSDSTEDMGGYLRPTFREQPITTSTPKTSRSGSTTDSGSISTTTRTIPAESYVTSQEVKSTANDSQQPLILQPATEV